MNQLYKIIGIGEILWDKLPTGKQLGGAPGNFVYHAHKLGVNGLIVSAIGEDSEGEEIMGVLKNKGLSTDGIQVKHFPTGSVDVLLDKEGMPSYLINESVAWDFMLNTDLIEDVFSGADVVCFGSLAQRNVDSRRTIWKYLSKCSPSCLIVFDINIRQKYYSQEIILYSLELCNILKLNNEELPIVCELLNIGGNEKEQLNKLLVRFNLVMIIYTMGVNGSCLVTPTEESFMPTPQVEVKDTVGAGDAFTAAVVVSLLNKKTIIETHQTAVNLSAFVCTQDGAMPLY